MGRTSKKIRFKELPVGIADIKAVADVIRSKSLGMGQTVNELEEEFADYVGAKYAVALNSCTNSLFLTLMGQPVDHVGIPSMMVPLVANEIIHAGKRPYFVDNTNWVGSAYRLKNTNIVDSAHQVAKVGEWFFDHYVVCYSFYPTKPIGGADGGMICTNSEEEANWYRKARFFGRNEGDSLTKNSWEYGIEFPGWKMNMSDVQAAIVLTQLRKHPSNDGTMGQIRDSYNEILGLDNKSKYLYRINVENRDEFIKHMKENGVECGIHFEPLHMMECYKQYAMPNVDDTQDLGLSSHSELPKTEEEFKTTVSLPFHTFLSPQDISYICELTLEWKQKTVKEAI